jgi:hypothetical protein
MQILSMYVITDKQKDVSHDVTIDISFSWSMKSGNLQACSMGEFLVLTVLIHLCLRLNWLSRYVIVLLFDNQGK